MAKYLAYLVVSCLIVLCSIQSGFSQTSDDSVLIILDLSKSMNEKLKSGVLKVDVAKESVKEVLNGMSDKVKVGLRVYGGKSGFLGLRQCSQSSLIAPVASKNKEEILNKIEKLDPNGVTPIEYSLRKAVGDFKNIQGPKRIILISDGLETCNGDPCRYAKKMGFEHPDIKVDVISLVKNIRNVSLDSQLKCISLSTNGKFSSADTKIDLVNAIKSSFKVEKKLYWQIKPGYEP